MTLLSPSTVDKRSDIGIYSPAPWGSRSDIISTAALGLLLLTGISRKIKWYESMCIQVEGPSPTPSLGRGVSKNYVNILNFIIFIEKLYFFKESICIRFTYFIINTRKQHTPWRIKKCAEKFTFNKLTETVFRELYQTSSVPKMVHVDFYKTIICTIIYSKCFLQGVFFKSSVYNKIYKTYTNIFVKKNKVFSINITKICFKITFEIYVALTLTKTFLETCR